MAFQFCPGYNQKKSHRQQVYDVMTPTLWGDIRVVLFKEPWVSICHFLAVTKTATAQQKGRLLRK